MWRLIRMYYDIVKSAETDSGDFILKEELKKRQKWKEKEKFHATSHCLIQESKMRNTQRIFKVRTRNNLTTLVHQSQQHCPLSTGFRLLFPVFVCCSPVWFLSVFICFIIMCLDCLHFWLVCFRLLINLCVWILYNHYRIYIHYRIVWLLRIQRRDLQHGKLKYLPSAAWHATNC